MDKKSELRKEVEFPRVILSTGRIENIPMFFIKEATGEKDHGFIRQSTKERQHEYRGQMVCGRRQGGGSERRIDRRNEAQKQVRRLHRLHGMPKVGEIRMRGR
jgi:hypothetical protein